MIELCTYYGIILRMNVREVKKIFEQGLGDQIIVSDSSSCNIDILKAKVDKWKNTDYKIVFTAGIFDIFTINHLIALYHYKLLGGKKPKLIVSIDTDERVKKAKSFTQSKGGSVKPILSWESRALMVAKQSFRDEERLVDLIVQHGTNTCGNLHCPHDDNVYIAEQILPDIIVASSGSQDTIDKIRRSTVLDDNRLAVIKEDDLAYIDLLLGQSISTTAIIKRIKHES